MKRLLLLCALVLLSAFEAPMMYSRAMLPVLLAHPKDGVNARLLFDAEIREAASVTRTPGWFNFATLGDANAALLAYTVPTPVTITRSNDFAPVDILMLNAYGGIVQLLPGLIPAQLDESIASPEPLMAVIYLKGGAAERFGISPGDRVEYKLFKKRPTVLTAPSKSETSAPAPTPAPVAPVTITPEKSTERDYIKLLDPRMNTQIKGKK